METPSPPLLRLAQRLLILEAEIGDGGVQAHGAVRVCEKLRASLTQFAGPEGFASLLRRSVALARADHPSLAKVTIDPGGSLEGLEAMASDTRNGGPEAFIGIIANLLGLLVTFIGEPLTLRLVRDAWPDASFDE